MFVVICIHQSTVNSNDSYSEYKQKYDVHELDHGHIYSGSGKFLLFIVVCIAYTLISDISL
jgi:hypothetical protein